MVTATHNKSRISRQEWQESRSYENRSEACRAIDPTAWQALTKLRSASPAFGWLATLDDVVVDTSTRATLLRALAARRVRVTVDVSATVAPREWDWEGADSYDRRTIERVRDLLKSLALIARDTFGYQLEVPHPAPADEGSIDVFFEGAERNLLINTPQGDELVTYFGSDRSGTTLGGSLSRRKSHRDLMALAAWIMEIR